MFLIDHIVMKTMKMIHHYRIMLVQEFIILIIIKQLRSLCQMVCFGIVFVCEWISILNDSSACVFMFIYVIIDYHRLIPTACFSQEKLIFVPLTRLSCKTKDLYSSSSSSTRLIHYIYIYEEAANIRLVFNRSINICHYLPFIFCFYWFTYTRELFISLFFFKYYFKEKNTDSCCLCCGVLNRVNLVWYDCLILFLFIITFFFRFSFCLIYYSFVIKLFFSTINKYCTSNNILNSSL